MLLRRNVAPSVAMGRAYLHQIFKSDPPGRAQHVSPVELGAPTRRPKTIEFEQVTDGGACAGVLLPTAPPRLRRPPVRTPVLGQISLFSQVPGRRGDAIVTTLQNLADAGVGQAMLRYNLALAQIDQAVGTL